ncbi:OmpH family outer membrane protein [Cardiobacterium sp. Marseille-Q4385]|uniref:OmpH family outer membrane protein n=1 Tax=Cardiobacterium sp. Marseille-Q4385 TaxID=2866573 RepID=UPI001CE3BA98|nr:OmpH family outer membrane protein [Cardiobacterium sp. Marseille-Q4385]
MKTLPLAALLVLAATLHAQEADTSTASAATPAPATPTADSPTATPAGENRDYNAADVTPPEHPTQPAAAAPADKNRDYNAADATPPTPSAQATDSVDPADLRIGFVNFRRIMAAAPQRDEVNERLEREFGVERDALLQAQSELRDMERRLETIRHGDAYNELERQVINKRRDVSRRDSDYRDNINVRRNEEMAKLQKMIGDEILSHAKEAGYDIILNDIGVFYVSERADLSPLIIKRLQNKAGKP